VTTTQIHFTYILPVATTHGHTSHHEGRGYKVIKNSFVNICNMELKQVTSNGENVVKNQLNLYTFLFKKIAKHNYFFEYSITAFKTNSFYHLPSPLHTH